MAQFDEVTEVLRRHPDVTRAFVVRAEVGDADLTLGVVEVRHYVSGAWLREHLWATFGDGGAVDGVLVFERIPGSEDDIDVAAVVEAARAEGGTVVFHAPSDELEAELSGIWAGVLGRPRVSVHDDFLDLGGESSAALEIVARVERATGQTLDVTDLLDAGTVSGLATLLRSRTAWIR